jgi:hypothetical protein
MAAGALLAALAMVAVASVPADAQDDPKPIGRVVVDVRGAFPKFAVDQLIADSRALAVNELPGRGLGLDAGAHLYLFKWKAVTFGVGGQLTFARARSSAIETEAITTRAITERFMSIAPQLSLNFGTGDGWSYLSGGIGTATWSIVPDGQEPTAADEERSRTINYGGGARWFSKAHLAFTFDVRFHIILPGAPQLFLPGSPRTTMLIIGGGVSVK